MSPSSLRYRTTANAHPLTAAPGLCNNLSQKIMFSKNPPSARLKFRPLLGRRVKVASRSEHTTVVKHLVAELVFCPKHKEFEGTEKFR